MRDKLGLQSQQSGDAELISELFEILQASHVDYTGFFRRLGDFKTGGGEKNNLLQGMFIDPASFDRWAGTYRIRLTKEASVDAERRVSMRLVNPKFVLRNHIAQMVIEQAQAGDYAQLNTLLEVLQKPFDEQPTMERFAEPPPEGSERIAVSCSS